jgi:acyl carrier protein
MKKIDKIKFLEIIKIALNINDKINLSTTISDIKEWDSVNNIKIILSLNKNLKKKIQFHNLNNIKKIRDLFLIYNK